MDNVPGEIIYIIVMLAIFIFSALKKKKGREGEIPVPKREMDNPMDEVFSPFKEIFGEEDDDEKKRKPEPVIMPDSPSKKKRENLRDTPFVKKDYVFTSNTSPGDTRRQRKNKAPGKQTDSKSDETESYGGEETYSEIEKWFDLRKAVVFSEILKRPDY